eukprot:gene11783-13676_t
MEEERTFSLGSVPSYLRGTALYLTFVEDEESGSVTLPAKYCAFDVHMDTPEQFQSILSTLHFWGSNEIPDQVFDFILSNGSGSNAQVLKEFDNLNFKTVDILSAMNTAREAGEHEKSMLNVALRFDSLALVKFLEGRGLSLDILISRVCDAAGQGSIECLTYIHSKGGKLDRAVVDAAVISKRLACVRYCMQSCSGIELTPYHLERAAANGDLLMMQYLRSQDGKWSDRVCLYAVQSKSIACLQYAHANGAPWNVRTFEIAVEGGSLEILQYLHEHSCPPSPYLCAKAAAGGHLECLIYLKDSGYVLSSYTCETAAQNGQLECLKYAQAQGCELKPYAMQIAAAYGHLNILQYGAELKLLGRSASLCQGAASGNHLEVLKFLHERGCPLSVDIAETTARRGNVCGAARMSG